MADSTRDAGRSRCGEPSAARAAVRGSRYGAAGPAVEVDVARTVVAGRLVVPEVGRRACAARRAVHTDAARAANVIQRGPVVDPHGPLDAVVTGAPASTAARRDGVLPAARSTARDRGKEQHRREYSRRPR